MAYRVTGCRLWVRLTLALVGIVVGVSASIVFGIVYKNIHVSIWSILSAAWAAMTFFLHMAVHRDKNIEIKHSSFLHGMVLGLLGFLAGVAAFFVYLTKGILDNETGVHAGGHYIVVVWAFMLLKWGLALLLHSKWYREEMAMAFGDVQGGTEDSVKLVR